MRPILVALILLSAVSFPILAHADGIDDFVLSGDGHTFTFSLPATGVAYISLNPPRLSDHYSVLITTATVDGIGGYTGNSDFRFYALSFGNVILSFANPDLGRSFDYYLYGGESLIGYSSVFGEYNDMANVFFRPGSFNLSTHNFNSNPITTTPFTLTITPEASTTVTPEPATLTLLATGSLGLLTALRRPA